jgi:hypothetical protein
MKASLIMDLKQISVLRIQKAHETIVVDIEIHHHLIDCHVHA